MWMESVSKDAYISMTKRPHAEFSEPTLLAVSYFPAYSGALFLP